MTTTIVICCLTLWIVISVFILPFIMLSEPPVGEDYKNGIAKVIAIILLPGAIVYTLLFVVTIIMGREPEFLISKLKNIYLTKDSN